MSVRPNKLAALARELRRKWGGDQEEILGWILEALRDVRGAGPAEIRAGVRQVVLARLKKQRAGEVKARFEPLIGSLVAIRLERVRRGRWEGVVNDRFPGVLGADGIVRREKFMAGQVIRAQLVCLAGKESDPYLKLTRRSEGFARRVVEAEVPELREGICRIVSSARDPGFRTKLMVQSLRENVDAAGVCIGPDGGRIRRAVRELNGEAVDIIPFHPDPARRIAAAVGPARPLSVTLHEGEKRATIIVAPGDLALAIGKGGRNVRLASRLTGYRLDVLPADPESSDPRQREAERAQGVTR